MRLINGLLMSLMMLGMAVADESRPTSQLLTLMADAQEEYYQYLVRTTIDSDYRISAYRAYFYSPATNTIDVIQPEFETTKARIVDFTFERPEPSDAYLILEILYGPNFLYDTNAVGICVQKFDGTSIFDSIKCNPLTTAEYLVASAMHDSPEDQIINANATRQYLSLENLPNRKFWQDYLAIHQLLLAHLAETEDYELAHQGQYLSIGYQIVQHLLERVRKYRRMSVQDVDQASLDTDRTMVNLAYRLYMSLDGLIKRNIHLLPKVEASPGFITDFYTGASSFSLLTEEAAVVANLTQSGNKVTFDYWPWFNELSVKFDVGEPMISRQTEFTIPADSKRVDVMGMGSAGRYATLRYTILPFDNSGIRPTVATADDPPSNQVTDEEQVTELEGTQSE